MFEAVVCSVCRGTVSLERRLPEVDLFRCEACDHCFSDLSRATTSEQYGDDYYLSTHRNWFEHPNWRLFEFIHRQISAAKNDAAILDIGCGKCDLLKFLRRENSNYLLHGIDLSSNPPVAGVATFCGDVRTHRFDRSYDALVSLAAIEHLDDVHGFVRKLRELCLPGGQIIIMTLNDRSTLYGVARWLGKLGWLQPLVRLYDKHHLNHFNARSLRRLLTDNGLSVERTLMHNAPLKAMDFPASSWLVYWVQRAGVWGTFLIGRLVGATYLQTVVCRRV
jgi:2-polyprenyl-3-methyl-5-hydroxy-6-metoxy-1,4-benzoquinol methylase